MERQAQNRQDARVGPPGPRLRSRHHLRRSGDYLDFDADVDVAYGDGTPGTLADLLRRPRTDPWQSDRPLWDAAHDPWHEPEEENR